MDLFNELRWNSVDFGLLCWSTIKSVANDITQNSNIVEIDIMFQNVIIVLFEQSDFFEH